jgi:hypothetical protein
MRILRRRAARTESSDIAAHAVQHSHGWMTPVVSAVALLFSAYSLWETSLKQADLRVYATGAITYERDLTADEYLQPTGGFEVFAVPVTIANSGARDAAVLKLQLEVNNPKTGLGAIFEATYTAEAAYFAGTGAKRPKAPFSALVIPGRAAWTGTVLFYPVSYSNGKALTPVTRARALNETLRTKYADELGGASSIGILRQKRPDLPEFAELDAYRAKVLNQNDKVEVTLKAISPAPGGWLDRLLEGSTRPIAFTLDMPDIPMQRVERGEVVRLLRTGAAG